MNLRVSSAVVAGLAEHDRDRMRRLGKPFTAVHQFLEQYMQWRPQH